MVAISAMARNARNEREMVGRSLEDVCSFNVADIMFELMVSLFLAEIAVKYRCPGRYALPHRDARAGLVRLPVLPGGPALVCCRGKGW